MLQYIVKSDNVKDILAEARQALKGGCRWIEIKAPAALSDEILKPALKELLEDVRKAEGMLLVADRVTLCKDAGCDGVQLYRDDMPVSAARMELEAAPIIGVTVNSWEEILRQYRLDVDFFRYEPAFNGEIDNLPLLREIADKVAENDVERPLAATGGITCDNFRDVLAAGAVGIAVDSSLAQAHDVSLTEAVRRLIGLMGRD